MTTYGDERWTAWVYINQSDPLDTRMVQVCSGTFHECWETVRREHAAGQVQRGDDGQVINVEATQGVFTSRFSCRRD